MSKIIALLLLACPLFAADALRLTLGGPLPITIANTPGYGTFAIDATTDRVEYTFQASDPTIVTTLLFRYSVRVGTPTQYKISLQDLAATGNASGTPLATAAFTPPADTTWDGLIQEVSLSHDGAGGVATTYTLTRGSWYAMVIEACPDATAPCAGLAAPDGSNHGVFNTVLTNLGMVARAGTTWTGTSTNSGSTWTKAGDTAIFGYRSASLTFGFPLESFTSTAISTGAESGLLFTIPSTFWSTAKVVGVRFIGTTPAAAKSVKFNLYSGTTVLQSTTWDSDWSVGAGSAYRVFQIYFTDASLAALTAGSSYRIGVTPQDSSNGVALMTLGLRAAGDRTAFPGGASFTFTSRTACGAACDTTATAWSDTTTSRPMMELILDDITAPSGGGQKAYGTVQ